MSNQPENENQQTMTPEEVRQQILTELEASKQAITELNDEELEEIAGGIFTDPVPFTGPVPFTRKVGHAYGKAKMLVTGLAIGGAAGIIGGPILTKTIDNKINNNNK